MVNYLVKLYCVCILWTNYDVNQINTINPSAWSSFDEIQMVWLEYHPSGVNQTNTDNMVRSGVNAGCQVKYSTPSVIECSNI